MNDTRRRFEAQVLVHLDAAYRYARWLSRSPADADDVVQDALLRAYRGFDALRGDAKAWLLTIVRNTHLSAARHRQARSAVPLPDESEPSAVLVDASAGPESEAIRADQQRSLAQALSELPVDYREVLVLREIEDLDYREIADITHVPIGTVMSRLARARAALRGKWVQQHGAIASAVR